MDISKRKRAHPIYVRTILSLIFFSVLYVSLIRPIRVYINSEYLQPRFSQLALDERVQLKNNSRRIDILQEGYNSPRGFGIPFGGYFWLPLALLVACSNKNAALALTSYHLLLFIIPPGLGILFIKGHQWAGTLLQVNEMLFLGIFMFALFFGGKEIINNKYKK